MRVKSHEAALHRPLLAACRPYTALTWALPRPQVLRGSGRLLQGWEEGGAVRHHLPQDQPEEGRGHADGVGDRPIRAHPGLPPQRLQAHGRHPGLPGLHATADAAAVRHHPGEVPAARQM